MLCHYQFTLMAKGFAPVPDFVGECTTKDKPEVLQLLKVIVISKV